MCLSWTNSPVFDFWDYFPVPPPPFHLFSFLPHQSCYRVVNPFKQRTFHFLDSLYRLFVFYILAFISGFHLLYKKISRWLLQFSSVQSLSHVRLFATPWTASPTPGAYSNSCPSSQWFHPNTSSSVVPFFSCLQSFPASGGCLDNWFSAFLLFCVYVLVTQSCLTLCNPMSPPGSSVHGIFQARILEWVAISFFRGSSQPRDWTQVSRIAGRFFTIWATREVFYSTYTIKDINL